METLFDVVPLPVIATTADRRVLTGNTPARALFGDAARQPGSPITALLPFLAQPSGNGHAAAWQGVITDVTGRSVDVDVLYTAVPEGRLRVAGVYIIHDVSHYVALTQLREHLLYSVAHELRGPLTVLTTTLQIISTQYTELPFEDLERLLAMARRTSLRLQHLMEDLLSAGAIQSGRFSIQRHIVLVSAVVAAALEDSDATLHTRGQRVGVSIEPHDLTVVADERAIRQVLVNLLSNAAKYGPVDDCITLHAEQTDGGVRIAVADHGPGIPAEQCAGLFERFYRVRPGNEEPGIGLGLAIVKGIVEAHGGTIGLESAPGRGTCVWFTLPRVETAA